MSLTSIDDALRRIRRGEMVLVVDDEDRENEGDLTLAAEWVTPEAVNFMMRWARGLVWPTGEVVGDAAEQHVSPPPAEYCERPSEKAATCPRRPGASQRASCLLLRQIDARENLDHRAVVFLGETGARGLHEHLVRGARQRQREFAGPRHVQHQPQVFDEDVHGR